MLGRLPWALGIAICTATCRAAAPATVAGTLGAHGAEAASDVALRLAPLVRDLDKHLAAAPASAERSALLQGVQNFFSDQPAQGRIEHVVSALLRFRSVPRVQPNLLATRRLLSSAPSAAMPVAPAAAPPMAPLPPPPPPPPPMGAEMVATPATVAMAGAIDSASARIGDAVDGLNHDVDNIFHFLDDVAYWKRMTPHMVAAVREFTASYRQSLQGLSAAVDWHPGDGPPPFFGPLPGAPGAAAPGGAPGAPGFAPAGAPGAMLMPGAPGLPFLPGAAPAR